jgi:hypothetical protein
VVSRWEVAVAAVVLALAGYRYSLYRNPTTKCHRCRGTGKNRGWVWSYAQGPCRAKGCKGGRKLRWGARQIERRK